MTERPTPRSPYPRRHRMIGARSAARRVARDRLGGAGMSARGEYDAIVVGLGAMGSAAAYHLSRRDQRVLGLEAFAPGHMNGSSHGESRIIRLAYYEHPNYVPILVRAYELWVELQAAAGEELLRLTGGIFAGRPETELVAGSIASVRRQDRPHEILDAA